MGVLEDLWADLFLLTARSILSSGRGNTVGGPQLLVQGSDKDVVRGTLVEVAVFLLRLKVGLVVVWGLVGIVRLNRKSGSFSSLSLASSTTNSLSTYLTS